MRRGMTLVEVLVAVTILGIVATVVFGGFSQTMRNKRRVEEQADRAHVIRVAMERMVSELSMAYVSAHQNVSPALQTMNTCFIGGRQGRGHRIDFTSFSHRRLYRDAHESDQNELSYFLTEHPERDGLVLARREQNRIDNDPQTGGTIQILVEDALEFEVEYLEAAPTRTCGVPNTRSPPSPCERSRVHTRPRRSSRRASGKTPTTEPSSHFRATARSALRHGELEGRASRTALAFSRTRRSRP